MLARQLSSTVIKLRKPCFIARAWIGMQAKGETWSAVLETQLCYEVKTFLLAGHETSAAMLTWTLYELTRRPDMLAKVCCHLRQFSW